MDSAAAAACHQGGVDSSEIDLLVRPGRMSLRPDDCIPLPHGPVITEPGWISKAIVGSPARLDQLTRRTSESSAGSLPLLLSVNQEGGRLNALDWPGVAQLPGNLALSLLAKIFLPVSAGIPCHWVPARVNELFSVTRRDGV
ncbi:hypothetical protein OOK41_13860 [Micromonospora sp. NBC_01655]|uniref:hypothetical protein n=1 Tax=Micromonospora sp. NBC_01655 TaxID=2975983 RepID=UPI00225A90F7|nr:hypothetical protein [Micromonospora sp. NBC_01655]MCX4471381.1 hypothetical protein [Micromonospora sp. NBC_01655]